MTINTDAWYKDAHARLVKRVIELEHRVMELESGPKGDDILHGIKQTQQAKESAEIATKVGDMVYSSEPQKSLHLRQWDPRSSVGLPSTMFDAAGRVINLRKNLVVACDEQEMVDHVVSEFDSAETARLFMDSDIRKTSEAKTIGGWFQVATEAEVAEYEKKKHDSLFARETLKSFIEKDSGFCVGCNRPLESCQCKIVYPHTEPVDDSVDPVTERFREACGKTIREKLAEDKLPITEEWLISVGGKKYDENSAVFLDMKTRRPGYRELDQLELVEGCDGWFATGCGKLSELKTRRDVSILCELLRIELKETT